VQRADEGCAGRQVVVGEGGDDEEVEAFACAEFGEIALQEFDPPGFGAVDLD
jgi:hypothetical protein